MTPVYRVRVPGGTRLASAVDSSVWLPRQILEPAECVEGLHGRQRVQLDLAERIDRGVCEVLREQRELALLLGPGRRDLDTLRPSRPCVVHGERREDLAPARDDRAGDSRQA